MACVQGVLRAGGDPAGDGGEHEPRAALRAGVDGRRLLRGQERRVRRRRRSGPRHGAPHPRPHLRHQTGGGRRAAHVVVHHRRSRLPCNDNSSRRRRGTTGRAMQAMIDAAGIGIAGHASLFAPQRPSRVGHLRTLAKAKERRWIGYTGVDLDI